MKSIHAALVLALAMVGCLGVDDGGQEARAGHVEPLGAGEEVIVDKEVPFTGEAWSRFSWDLPPQRAWVRVELFAPSEQAATSVQGRAPAGISEGMAQDWRNAACRSEPWKGIQACTMAPSPGGQYTTWIQWRASPSATGVTKLRVRVIASIEPLVMHADAASVHLADFPGALYVRRRGDDRDQRSEHGIVARDLLQGSAGDCYFIAGAACVAEDQPQLLQKAIDDQQDGTYLVRFYRPGIEPPELVEVLVTGRLPLRDDTRLPAYATSPYPMGSDPWELWPMILEKAYAKFRGGYEAIGQGGSSRDALSLTGYRISMYATAETRPEDVFAAIQDGRSQGGFMVASTHPNRGGTGGDVPDAAHQEIGIVPSHMYSVFGGEVAPDDGTRSVLLRNPWGYFEPGQPWGNGWFDHPLELFMRDFGHLTVALPRGDAG